MKVITVRLDEETHRRVKVRAVHDGVAMEAIARVWFEAYGAGGTVTASTETTVGPRNGGLAAGEVAESDGPGGAVARVAPVAGPSVPPAPAASPTKRCSREARHHINHGGNPCKECGYPKETL